MLSIPKTIKAWVERLHSINKIDCEYYDSCFSVDGWIDAILSPPQPQFHSSLLLNPIEPLPSRTVTVHYSAKSYFPLQSLLGWPSCLRHWGLLIASEFPPIVSPALRKAVALTSGPNPCCWAVMTLRTWRNCICESSKRRDEHVWWTAESNWKNKDGIHLANGGHAVILWGV